MDIFVGSRAIKIRDEAQATEFPAMVLYPTHVPSTPIAFGPYRLMVSPEAAIAPGCYPLVIISHGNGGDPLLYRSIGMHLAENGYVVAMIEHPGNNRLDNSLADTYENLVNRPRHVRLTIDAVLADGAWMNAVCPERVAIVGHSLGGYTALAVAGGQPWFDHQRPVEVVADPRVAALVLLAPATPWYRPARSLQSAHIPILMLIAEHDPYTPRWQADIVLNGVPDPAQVTFRIIQNAGHFSFLSPYPPAMKRPGFLPATDPDGFDRELFHQVLPADVRQYLDRVLQGSS